jgi:universal stress protein A
MAENFFIYPGSPEAPASTMLTQDFVNNMENILREHLDACVRQTSAKNGILVCDAADSAILEATEKLSADLVVVGTHGRTGLGRLVLGSVAEAVVRGARCSVLVVRLKA